MGDVVGVAIYLPHFDGGDVEIVKHWYHFELLIGILPSCLASLSDAES